MSVLRHEYMTSLICNQSDKIKSPLLPGDHSYLIKLSIGTPPHDLYLSLDTGSSLIWTQCLPCIKCYPQLYTLFDPHKSSMYDPVACPSNLCSDLYKSSCYENECVYSQSYADLSYTRGNLASDTFTIASENSAPISISSMIFGCGDDNGGIFSFTECGILGLGGGPLSLVTQLGPDLGWQFSYCFAPPGTQNNSSYGGEFVFGSDARLYGNCTPMIANRTQDGSTHYYLSLNDISVGDEQLSIPPGTFDKKSDGSGGFIIDSGVKFTILQYSAFDLLVKSLRKAITLEPVSGGSDMTALCYKGTKQTLDEGNKVPNLTFHFSDLDVILHPVNYFDEETSGVICLTIISKSDISVLGFMAQQNKNIGYDLENQRLYISDVDC
ncbi:hypothetical protein LUZ63_010600 [Rhynchospora breviuscula]|uniref:Peptidase A1 domain-containing protein n=1 Tax=Rhynchospora breviuscula TaxID=2022672 RepID=A0A9Q0CH79_9POAL|nr:hypothetical protein LUZ63_010600 [Rhynchospora breviuscula]